jgi:hypothetical protein
VIDRDAGSTRIASGADLLYARSMTNINTRAARLLTLLTLVLCSGQLGAGPAPWWQYRSKIDGKLACSQTPLGAGWQKVAGPYKDSRCEKLVLAK